LEAVQALEQAGEFEGCFGCQELLHQFEGRREVDCVFVAQDEFSTQRRTRGQVIYR
jgi:hypothetical protein